MGVAGTGPESPDTLSSALVTRPWASHEANLLTVSPLQVKGLQASLYHPYLGIPGRQLL